MIGKERGIDSESDKENERERQRERSKEKEGKKVREREKTRASKFSKRTNGKGWAMDNWYYYWFGLTVQALPRPNSSI